MAPSSPFAAQHRPQGRKTVPIRSEGQALGDAAFAAFAALAVSMEKLPSLPSPRRLRPGVKPPSLPSLLQHRRHFTHIRCCGKTQGWVSVEGAITAITVYSLASSEAAFIAITAAARKVLRSPSLVLVPRGVMRLPSHSGYQTKWEGRRIICFHCVESC